MTPKPAIYTAKTLDEPLALPYDDVVNALTHGTIQEELGLMRFGSNYTFLVTVCHEGAEFLAVYKPQSGERPLWDFPDGTLCQREVAACALSEVFGWYLVPPTVLREDAPRGRGSLQVFIHHDPERHYFTFTEAQTAEVQRMVAFDVVANNADRKGGHCLLDETGRVWGIDHGLCFNHAYKLRTVIWDFANQELPDPILADLLQLETALQDPEHATTRTFASLLDETEMRMLKKRVTKLSQTKHYPAPTTRHSHPWPPV